MASGEIPSEQMITAAVPLESVTEGELEERSLMRNKAEHVKMLTRPGTASESRIEVLQTENSFGRLHIDLWLLSSPLSATGAYASGNREDLRFSSLLHESTQWARMRSVCALLDPGPLKPIPVLTQPVSLDCISNPITILDHA